MTPIQADVRLFTTDSMETPTASRPRRTPRRASVESTPFGCEAPTVRPRRSTRKASITSTKSSFNTTFITQLTGKNWKTDTQIRNWIICGDVLDYLKGWKSQYLDNASHAWSLQNMLDIDISKWAQRIPKIMEHRPVVEAFRMAADTTGWSPTEILCQRARFIVDKDQGNMLPRDSSRIAWSYEVVIRLLFAVLYDLINDREGFCSKMLGPLNAQWDFPWTPAETKLEELADFESHSLPQEHDEDLDRSSRGLSTIDEEEEGFVKVSEPADKDKAAGDNADDNDEDNAIDTGELGDEDEFSLSEHSEHSSRSFTAHEPDISDREDAYEARNPDAVRQHIDSVHNRRCGNVTNAPGIIRPNSRGPKRPPNPTMLQSSPSSIWPPTSPPPSTLSHSTSSRNHSIGGMSVFEIIGLRLDADRRLTIAEEELRHAHEALCTQHDKNERLKHKLQDAERRLITEEGLTNNARRETRDARTARDREREARRVAEMRARGAELRLWRERGRRYR